MGFAVAYRLGGNWVFLARARARGSKEDIWSEDGVGAEKEEDSKSVSVSAGACTAASTVEEGSVEG